jgi:hypothetical protein
VVRVRTLIVNSDTTFLSSSYHYLELIHGDPSFGWTWTKDIRDALKMAQLWPNLIKFTTTQARSAVKMAK